MKLVADRAGRADKLLAEKLPGRGRAALARAFDAGIIRVNGRRASKGDRVSVGDTLEVLEEIPDRDALRPVPEPDLPLEVLFEDPFLVAVNKPPGMASHPLQAGERGTLANALVARHPECLTVGQDPREAGLVHRLDSGTSGVLIAARDADTWTRMRALFHDGKVDKTYLALVAGAVAHDGEIDFPIAHDPKGGVRVCTDPVDAIRKHALPAVTHFAVVRRLPGHTLLRCAIVGGGRMHQIRAHLAHAGTPIVGDDRYGGEKVDGLAGHFLHAERAAFTHPSTGADVVIEAPPGPHWAKTGAAPGPPG